jgi:hypothetical protein
VQLNAIDRQLHGKRRWMRPFLGAALDGFIGNEPGVAATTFATARAVRQRAMFDLSA